MIVINIKKAIRIGDKTNHGGTVITGSARLIANKRGISHVGDLVVCPLCKGVFPIIDGTMQLSVEGENIACEGMYTACGAKLIASAD